MQRLAEMVWKEGTWHKKVPWCLVQPQEAGAAPSDYGRLLFVIDGNTSINGVSYSIHNKECPSDLESHNTFASMHHAGPPVHRRLPPTSGRVGRPSAKENAEKCQFSRFPVVL